MSLTRGISIRLPGVDAESLATLSSGLTLIGEKIAMTNAKMKAAKDAKAFGVYQETLIELNDEKARVKAEYDTLRMRLSSPAVECVSDARTLIGLMKTTEDALALRLKIRARVRQLINRIFLLTWDDGKDRYALCQVNFPDDTRRYFLTGYSPTVTKTAFSGMTFGSDRLKGFPYDLGTFATMSPEDRQENTNEAIGWLKQLTFN